MHAAPYDPSARRTDPPVAPSRRRLDIDGIVGIACAVLLPVALLLV